MESEKRAAKLCPMALGMAGGILWAVALLFFALVSETYGAPVVDFMSNYYLGYKAGFVGGLIGAVWAFFDAFIGLALFGWLYNVILGKAEKCRARRKCCLGKCEKE